jgi:anti-sigma regulatory factor (Ser/Thr protein kinase)
LSVCRAETAEFDALDVSSRLARRWVRDILGRWELPGLIESATLLTSELVTNAIVHAQSAPVVLVAVGDGVVEVAVSDRKPLPARTALVFERRQPADGSTVIKESGRGMLLIDVLADDWGVAEGAEGKQVWFRLSAGDWPYGSACRCHGAAVDRVPLASGGFVLATPGPWDHPTADSA